ncbi:hypothetical protein BDK89_2101 [Ilumatobacter fluminis]|uniref:3-methyladenine DNA glycosylase/8-oxoguanine DNA glycosylase n=1 Tax=Ilumatobacter fluminis TaxID=467091 RepID=A0A4R7I050_9ACTN|nr:DNA-3-methyladenine glycosylase 2 family protein [Ilumatobacter fluminis]TDT16510.1 hypothetical protein BDK89_2101 [Ilumatobacter fluminis]
MRVITRTSPPSRSAPEATWRTVEAPRSLRRTLGAYQIGGGDPTTRLEPGRFRRATLTPDGPGTLQLTWRADPAPVDDDGLDAGAWGPGADWLLARVDALTGRRDQVVEIEEPEESDRPVVAALAASRTIRLGASGTLYHELLPTIIGQRITGGEALRQWHRLVRELGEPAPGPPEVAGELRLPPAPATLYRRPTWWFHPLGIEDKRARALTEVARHPQKLFAWADLSPADAAAKMTLIPGVGPWTAGTVRGLALGDPDAVVVGDYHYANVVAWALAGEARADDDRMLELLAPYRGQRGRVMYAVVRATGSAPKFGPRQRILPMSKW